MRSALNLMRRKQRPGAARQPSRARALAARFTIVCFLSLVSLGNPQRAGAQAAGIDFGDAPLPFPTILNNNGARHTIVAGGFLGQRVDSENDGQPSPLATGDDAVPVGNPSDEDGVQFIGSLSVGQTATVQVIASTTGILNAWIDFAGNTNFT